MPDWSDVRHFLEVSRAGTLAAAARKLKVDDTTVGRRVAALERELGAKLFERTPDGLVLTAAGEAMRAAGEEMEQAALRGEQRVIGTDRAPSGLVRFATTEMLGRAVVLPAIRRLRETHPQIRVELNTGVARLDIARREADAALRDIRPESGALVSRRAARVAFTAYASREYLAARPRPVRGGGFAGHDVVAFEPTIRAWREGELAGEPLHDTRTALRTNNGYVLLDAVALGIGIGDLPCHVADLDPRLRRVFADDRVELEDVFLVAHEDVQRTGRVRAVLEAVEAQLKAIAPLLLGDRPQQR